MSAEGPRFGHLGRFREPLRARTFPLLQQALQTDDGRRILADVLSGLIAGVPPPPDVTIDVADYPELGRARPPAVNAAAAPIFVSGRFRSGSTLLWNLFRHVDAYRAYYEPLNERRWFDPSHRGSRVDTTHLGVTDYWKEYEGLTHLSEFFRDDWISRNLHMDADHWDGELLAYITGLIEAAAPNRAVLQFNRADFRLAWLRRWFPDARIVHLYRHPRDQWCSTLVDPGAFPATGRMEAFSTHDRFYLLVWARDLSLRFPFLDPRTVAHPYELFYMIWKLSWLYGRRYAHHSVGFERLVSEPVIEIQRLLDAVGIEHADIGKLAGLVADRSRGRWRDYADDGWFAEQEARGDAVIAQWTRGETGVRAEAPRTPPQAPGDR